MKITMSSGIGKVHSETFPTMSSQPYGVRTFVNVPTAHVSVVRSCANWVRPICNSC